jgi:hypothetical protein
MPQISCNMDMALACIAGAALHHDRDCMTRSCPDGGCSCGALLWPVMPWHPLYAVRRSLGNTSCIIDAAVAG